MEKLCGYCCYLDVTDYKDGTYYCEKHKDYRYADENACYKFCPRWNRDMHLGDEAIKHSKSYKESNSSSTNFGCIVTNIMVNILGFKDDSKIMNSLRELRDEYMQKSPICKNILMMYDYLGPQIINKMNIEENVTEIAIDIYNVYIKKAVFLINNKKYSEAVVILTDMLKSQIKRYAIPKMPKELESSYNQTIGGHGKIIAFTTNTPI